MLKKMTIAAEQGGAEAQFMLGVYYHKGMGGTVDEAAAIRWYRQAAEQGHSEAQFALGVCYDHHQGVARDVVEAYKWFLLAGTYGNEPTGDLRGRLVTKMTAEQIAEAQERVQKWRQEQAQSRAEKARLPGERPSATAC